MTKIQKMLLTSALVAQTSMAAVTVPQLTGGFDFTAAGLFWQPSVTNDDLDYFNDSDINNDSNIASAHSTAIKPDFAVGYDFNLGYIFRNTGNDLNLNYLHLDTEDNTSTQGGPNGLAADIPLTFIPNVGETLELGDTTAQGTAKFNLDQVDLTGGQYINITERLQAHLLAGLRYIDFQREIIGNYTGLITQVGGSTPVNPSSGINETIDELTNLRGGGPLAGFVTNYNLGNGFGLEGGSRVTLLGTEIQSELNSTILLPGSELFNGFSNQAKFLTGNTFRVVPQLALNLAINYSIMQKEGSHWAISAGYHFSDYFNAVDLIKTSASIENVGGFNDLTFGNLSHKTSDLILQGPYVSLSFFS